MAACFFLLKQFDDVLLYLNSIKSYYYNEDTFNYNYGQAKASVGNFKDAEEVFLQVQSDKLQNDYAYLSWLARCYIMNGKARLAWELYLKMETSKSKTQYNFDNYCPFYQLIRLKFEAFLIKKICNGKVFLNLIMQL